MFQEPVVDNSEKALKPKKPAKPPRVLKSQKVWSENTNKFFYRAPKEYYREFYHKNKTERICPHCNAVINSQFSHHLQGKKCTAIRQMKELEARVVELEVKVEEVER